MRTLYELFLVAYSQKPAVPRVQPPYSFAARGILTQCRQDMAHTVRAGRQPGYHCCNYSNARNRPYKSSSSRVAGSICEFLISGDNLWRPLAFLYLWD